MQQQPEAARLACLNHEYANKFLPTGGWGWCMAGEPTRGFGSRQPGGWHYSILPYIEQVQMHEMGSDGNRAAITQRASMPVGTFICPSRRRVVAYPFISPARYANIANPTTIGRSDYAGCTGESNSVIGGVCISLPSGDSLTANDWANRMCGAKQMTGVFFLHSQTKIAEITDGTATRTWRERSTAIRTTMAVEGILATTRGGTPPVTVIRCDSPIVTRRVSLRKIARALG